MSDVPITREMIEAGALALARFDPRFESDEEAAARIYTAMIFVGDKGVSSIRPSRGTIPAEDACTSQRSGRVPSTEF